MLDTDYQRHLGSLIQGVPCQIELPEELQSFFEESGPMSVCENDRRRGVRTRVRTRGILIPTRWLPSMPRTTAPIAIYTKDFSKTGFGFLSDRQFFPGEEVRILLATFWMDIAVRRCRRLGECCYESGGSLLQQHDPSPGAFDGMEIELAESVK